MSELIGRNLGPYRVLQQLGMGGMATVYKAYQASMDRQVAIKVLPRHFAQDPTFVGRFEQEAKVIAKLEHARILPVYDYGEDDGITYIVMRYLDAGTLSERIHAGTIPLAETARIIAQISEGLDYAHKKGVIHRDIKPSNIMLDSNGDVYITDFGISKLIEGTAQFTGSGIVGTPDYVSPEQALGQPIDRRSDIYSMGIVLYQMATNDVPFHAETPMAVIIKHIHDPLPLPRSINPEIPESVENVILKALAKNPDDRYQSCSDLARSLSAAVGGAQIPAPEMSPSRLPTAIPQSTKPIPGFAEVGTLPLASPPEASAQTKVADSKKRPGWVLPAIIIGALLGLTLIVVLIVGVLRNIRDRRAVATAAATNIVATQSVAVVPTAPVATTSPTSAPGVAPSPAPPRVLIDDHFDGKTLNPGWKWLNEPQNKWYPGGGQLAVGVVPGSSVVAGHGLTYRLGSPALVQPVPADVIADSRYTIRGNLKISPTQNVQGAGLIVLSNNQQPLFTLARAFCSQPQPTCSGDAIYLDDWREVALNVNGYHARQSGGGHLPANGIVSLRLVIQPGRIGGEYSLDGGNHWELVGDWPLVAENRIGFLGLFTASGGQPDPLIPAQFDNFQVVLVPAQ